MGSITSLLRALDESEVARKVAIPHDEARMRYSLESNRVGSFEEFTDILADYYGKQFTSCVSKGGRLSKAEAAGRAKEIVEREYRRRGGNIVTAFNDAHDGLNGGLRAVLDMICEALKAESVERYVRDVFDRHVAPNSWEQKVDIIRQYLSQCGAHLSASIRVDQPERYAQNYEELIRSYVAALQRTAASFRRL